MSYATRFIPHSVELATLATWINQIESLSPNEGITLFEESAGSGTEREYVAMKDAQPTVGISTSDLAILTTIGVNGLAVGASPMTVSAVNVYGRALPLGSLPQAIGTTGHVKLTCASGLLVPGSIRASHNGVAKLSLTLHGNSLDGTTAPFIYAASTITAGAGAMANVYTTGPFMFTKTGGSQVVVAGIKDLSVDFGIQVVKESSDGDVYPTHLAIIARMARVEFTTSDLTLFELLDDGTTNKDGVSVSSAKTFFRQVSPAGQRVAAATATHVSVVGSAGMLIPGGVTLTHKQAGTATVSYIPTHATQAVTISATAAIA
jgi:hypothetical protein